MVADASLSANDYPTSLAAYIQTRSEAALYQASLLSQTLVASGLGPEDIIALHCESLDQITEDLPHRDQVHAITDANQFLLEVMIGYGVHFKQYLDLKLQETVRTADARVALEQERVEEVERIGREREEILQVIAHELRNPITAAKANLDLVELSFSSGKSELVPRLVGNARIAVERLSRLSADLVEASRGEPAALTLAPLDVVPILQQACGWVAAAAASQEIALTTDLPTTPLQVQGNADALLSVCGNLLSNALRYTPAGGQVQVRAGSDGDTAWIEVQDTGIGIAPEQQARIFEKFYRAPEARSVETRGLGIGLALVQQLVLAHQGQVAVASTLGKGSIFRVTLPRVTQ